MPLRTRNSELKPSSVDSNGRSLRAVPSRLSYREPASLRPPQRRPSEMPAPRRGRRPTVRLPPVKRLSPEPTLPTVAQALHTGQLGGVVGRDKEIEFLQTTINNCIKDSRSGSLYISGAPGTGKTATVTQVAQSLSESKQCTSIFLNCMQMASPKAVFTSILEKLGETRASGGTDKVVSRLEACLEKTTKRLPLIMVLDEIDQLASRCQEVLYT